MPELQLEQIGDKIILYFGTEKKAINAYTLASMLVSFADAIKEANRIINPGYDVEILVVDAKAGSFKTVIITQFKSLKDLFSAQDAKHIILEVLILVLAQKCIPDKPNVIINNYSDSVVIEYDTQKVVISKEAYETAQQIEQQPKVREKISETMKQIRNDESITSFGFAGRSIDDEPYFTMTRDDFDKFIIDKDDDDNEQANTRVISENQTTVQIIKAILEKSTRKWEFVWNGVIIAAPILDDDFYKKLFDHTITLATGDKLLIDLNLHQKKSGSTGIFINDKYEVIKVWDHIPQGESHELDLKLIKGKENDKKH
jgi:hypothetical protein